MWRHPWLPKIVVGLILDGNPGGKLTNSNLEIAALILHEATLLGSCPEENIAAPHSVLDNMSIVSRITQDAFTIKPVIADLLHIHTLHLRQFTLKPSVFNHPGQENQMAYNVSHPFDLSDTLFLALISVPYT